MEDIKEMENAEQELEVEVENHEESDSAKWKDVYGKIEELYNKIDAITSKLADLTVTANTAETLAEEDDDEEIDEVTEMDNAFYERQRMMLEQGY